MFQKIDPAKEIFQLSRILSDTENDERTRLTHALKYVANATDADRVYVSYWDRSNQTMAVAAQWNAENLEPMPDEAVHLGNLSLLNEYLDQNAGMFKLHVEPVLLEHQLAGLLCLESAVPVSRSLSDDEERFVQLGCHLLAPFLNSCQPIDSPEEIDFETAAEDTPSNNDNDGAPLVLIVEDNKINQLTMSKIWKHMGARIELADNGADAIQLCLDQKFDLILMDLSMPIMDGFDTTREIVTNSVKNKNTPIVAVTAVTAMGTDTRCKKVGMAEYIAKPLRLARVKELVEKYLPELA